MIDKDQIKPHMPVVGSNDQALGMVDHIQGDSLKLTRDNTGKHHLIPLDWIDRIDDKVHVNRSADEVKQKWQTVN